MRQFILPDLGEGLEEAEIVTWHVNEGDRRARTLDPGSVKLALVRARGSART
jgi:hypothetical protein